MFLLDKYTDPSHARQFSVSLTGMAKRLGCNPEHLMMCFYLEARLNPKFQTSHYAGTGFLQLSMSEVKRLGITPPRLLRLSGHEQLPYFERYLTPYSGRMTTLTDTYMACFFQDGVGVSQSFYFRLPTKYSTANKIFPLRNNNRIQKWEVDKALRVYFMRMGWQG